MPAGPPLARGWARATAFVVFLGLDVLALGLLPVPEQLTAAVRSAVAPGLGLLPDDPGVAVALLVAALICTWAWFRWGASLPCIALWGAGIILTVWLFEADSHPHVDTSAFGPTGLIRGAHELTWVMAVYATTYWVGLLVQRLPFASRVATWRRRDRPANETALFHLPAADRARAIALWGFARQAGAPAPDASLLRTALQEPRLWRRAKLISLLAHGRWPTDPFTRDNAHLRAAFIFSDEPAENAAARAALADTHRSALAMPASEPGWVSLLDGTLLAAALLGQGHNEAGQRWAYVLGRWFKPDRGHRPEARHSFLGVSRARAPGWEHATAMAIAAAHGWCDAATEWQALRRQVLGAVGRGGRTQDDNRMVAAGRCWEALVGDPEARRLLLRVTSSPTDPIAQALDALAAVLTRDKDQSPGGLRANAPE
jgi:hypothetical protein